MQGCFKKFIPKEHYIDCRKFILKILDISKYILFYPF